MYRWPCGFVHVSAVPMEAKRGRTFPEFAGSCDQQGVGAVNRTCQSNVSPPTWVRFLTSLSLSFLLCKMGSTAPMYGKLWGLTIRYISCFASRCYLVLSWVIYGEENSIHQVKRLTYFIHCRKRHTGLQSSGAVPAAPMFPKWSHNPELGRWLSA